MDLFITITLNTKPWEGKLMLDYILQIYPEAAKIINIQSYRPGYLPYPARITLQLKSGEQVFCVLKASINEAKIIFEKNILQALNEFNLPVPKVFGNTFIINNKQEQMLAILLSELPGDPLPWINLNDLNFAYKTCQLVYEAVDKMHALTPSILSHPVSAIIPQKTLLSELKTIQNEACDWFNVPIFNEALLLMQSVIPKINCPLVFSNGDYNPLNFLVTNNVLTGLIDFEYACYEDPYIGFAKFLLWADDGGWSTGAKSGLVERYLYERQIAPVEFLSRLILRGLYHVHKDSTTQPALYMLNVISDAVQRLKSVIN